jgi:hypothetical protein
MSIRMLVKKDGEFPNTHVGKSKILREKGIYCARSQDREEKARKTLFERLDKEN